MSPEFPKRASQNEHVADFYNNLYTEKPKAFTGEPTPEVITLTDYLKSGTILDLGAGNGRNSLYLAERGYDVTSYDISSKAVELLKGQAAEKNIHLNVHEADISHVEISGKHDATICVFTLNFLTRADARAVIERMQKHTPIGGLNLLITFTTDGDFYRSNPATENFYIPNKEYLAELYKDWEILNLFERSGNALSGQTNVFAGIIARKK